MRKFYFTIVIAAMTCFFMNGFAYAEFITIGEMNGQVIPRWTQSYQTEWRTVNIDVQPTIPNVEAMPVLEVKAAKWNPVADALDEGWTGYPCQFEAFEYSRGDVFGLSKDSEQVDLSITPPYNYEKAYLYGLDFTLDNALTYLDEICATTGLAAQADFKIRVPSHFLVVDHLDKKGNIMLGRSCYSFLFHQYLHDIPVLNHFYDGKERYTDGEITLYPFLRWTIQTEKDAVLTGLFVTETSQLTEDIPLCDYSVIQSALEQEITSGRLRRIFDMDLGYVLHNTPGAIAEEGNGYGTALPFYAVPAWRINCYYVKDGKTELRDYTDKEVSERATREYGTLIINAQTGEIYDRFDDSPHTADYAGFISWEDVGGKP